MQITNYNSFVCGCQSLCCFLLPLMKRQPFALQELTYPFEMSGEFMHSFAIFCSSAPKFTHMICVCNDGNGKFKLLVCDKFPIHTVFYTCVQLLASLRALLFYLFFIFCSSEYSSIEHCHICILMDFNCLYVSSLINVYV